MLVGSSARPGCAEEAADNSSRSRPQAPETPIECCRIYRLAIIIAGISAALEAQRKVGHTRAVSLESPSRGLRRRACIERKWLREGNKTRQGRAFIRARPRWRRREQLGSQSQLPDQCEKCGQSRCQRRLGADSGSVAQQEICGYRQVVVFAIHLQGSAERLNPMSQAFRFGLHFCREPQDRF
jgi:hypothetical protein